MNNWKKAKLKINCKISDVVKNLNISAFQIALIVDKDNNFIGTITDGDIRRAFLKGARLNDNIKNIINQKPIIVSNKISKSEAFNIMKKKEIRHIPIIDRKKILGVHFRGSTYKTARGHAFPPTIKLMIKNIETLMQKYKYNKIFLVTEEQKYLSALKKKFGDKLIFYNSFRMNKLDSFKIYPRRNHRYLLGEEILTETLILSKCQGLTYIKSNVISAAIMFSQKKIETHEMFLGFNSRNKFFSNYLWFIKSFLPGKFGGLKFINKTK